MAIVVLDACVLLSAPPRDLLMELSLEGILRARWTDRIHEEWIRGLLRVRPDLGRDQLERTRILMNKAVPDCLVTGFERLIPGLALPDPDDRHVLAAAIKSQASHILTFNTRDFPREALKTYGIEASSPDLFLVELFALKQESFVRAVQRVRARLKRPAMSASEYLARLEKSGLKTLARKLERMEHLI
jgi:hypothetical protein